jgi:hypothetical protein
MKMKVFRKAEKLFASLDAGSNSFLLATLPFVPNRIQRSCFLGKSFVSWLLNPKILREKRSSSGCIILCHFPSKKMAASSLPDGS